MKHRPHRRAALLAALYAAWVLAGPAGHAGAAGDPLARFTAAQIEKLNRGEPVFQSLSGQTAGGKTGGSGQAFIVVRASAAQCSNIFREFDKQSEYFPRKIRTEVVRREGNRVWLHNVFDFYLAEIQYTVIFTIDRDFLRYDFEIDPTYPHDIPVSTGYYRFEPIDARRTLFTYAALKVDTGYQVPELVQDFLTSRDLPAVAVNVRRRIESGGKWKK